MQEVPPLEEVFAEEADAIQGINRTADNLAVIEEAEADADNPAVTLFSPIKVDNTDSTDDNAFTSSLAAVTDSVSVTVSSAAAVSEPEDAPATVQAAVKTDSEPAAEYVIQIGAYGEKTRAESVAVKIRRRDFSVQLQPLSRNSETLWRVWVTEFSSRAAAVRAQEKLAQIGYAGTRLLSAAPAADNAVAAEPPGSYMLQVGSFRARPNADKAVAVLRDFAETAQITEVTVDGVVFFRVTAAGFESRVVADKVRQQLAQAGYHDTTILPVQ